jgi:hypothetical protein
MASDDSDFDLFKQMSEEEFEDMLLDDYDPATDPCELLWPVMTGVFAQELADFVMEKGGASMEE